MYVVTRRSMIILLFLEHIFSQFICKLIEACVPINRLVNLVSRNVPVGKEFCELVQYLSVSQCV